ncbi:MAG: T9SS type A sorting domain-containing protein, partial [Syntrophothermus sp.]
SWAVGFTPLFHSGWMNNDAYDEIGATDVTLKFPSTKADTAFGWTQYSIYYKVPNDTKAKAFSVRIHVYSRFQGKIWFDDLTVENAAPTGVKYENTAVKSFSLDQNYPNPFNPSTTISYALPESRFVSLKVYDMLGREIKTLISTEQAQGVYNVTWNGDNNYGQKVSSGTYFYRIDAGSFSQIRKMMLVK